MLLLLIGELEMCLLSLPFSAPDAKGFSLSNYF